MKSRAAQSGLLTLLCAAVVQVAGAAERSPEEWLARMESAVEYQNYEGTLVYMRPGLSQMFRVYHRVEGDSVTDRVVEMDGAGAEIIRSNDEVVCIFPDREMVVVEERSHATNMRNPLQENLPRYDATLAEFYALRHIGDERVVDREAAVITIEPRDEFRYGYRLWLDHATGMPLKSQLLAGSGPMPVEEIRFTSIQLPELVAVDKVRSSRDTAAYTWRHHGKPASREIAPAALIRWQAHRLPPGFMQTAAMHQRMNGATEPRLHLVYSDGLASVSVFVDMGVAAGEQVEGVSMVGAANAWSVMREGMLVTAMGEVPVITVESIATSMAATAGP